MRKPHAPSRTLPSLPVPRGWYGTRGAKSYFLNFFVVLCGGAEVGLARLVPVIRPFFDPSLLCSSALKGMK
jgi:hypothetical protein